MYIDIEKIQLCDLSGIFNINPYSPTGHGETFLISRTSKTEQANETTKITGSFPVSKDSILKMSKKIAQSSLQRNLNIADAGNGCRSRDFRALEKSVKSTGSGGRFC